MQDPTQGDQTQQIFHLLTLGRLGVALGRLGVALGRLGVALGRLGMVLGKFWVALGQQECLDTNMLV